MISSHFSHRGLHYFTIFKPRPPRQTFRTDSVVSSFSLIGFKLSWRTVSLSCVLHTHFIGNSWPPLSHLITSPLYALQFHRLRYPSTKSLLSRLGIRILLSVQWCKQRVFWPRPATVSQARQAGDCSSDVPYKMYTLHTHTGWQPVPKLRLHLSSSWLHPFLTGSVGQRWKRSVVGF